MRIIAIIGAALAACAIVAAAVAVDTIPAPKLTYAKVASAETDIGGVIGYTISVTNSGDADSDSQTMSDTLPGGVDWWIAGDSWGCTLAPSVNPGRTVLRCNPAIVPKRNLEGVDKDGELAVTVYGQAYQCGAYFNVAVFNGQVPSNPAIAYVRCPATPTPVATATPTTPPTVAPTATPTPPPPPEPTATVAPSRPAPKAPSTGNSGGTGVPSEGTGWPWAFIVLAIFFGGGATLLLWGRNKA